MRYFDDPSPNALNPRFPCGICSKNVGQHRKAIKCDLCGYWNHIKCEQIDDKTYDKLKKQDDSTKTNHFCKTCFEDNVPFQKLSDNEFFISIIKNIEFNEDLNLTTSPPTWLKTLFTDFSYNNKDEPAPINCKYYDLSSKIPKSGKNNYSMLHLNLASLGRHKDELTATLSLLDFDFDLIAISETKIIKNVEPNYDVSIEGYNHHLVPTESTRGGVLIYVKSDIDVKRRYDLETKMYKKKELESVFLELVNDGKKMNFLVAFTDTLTWHLMNLIIIF